MADNRMNLMELNPTNVVEVLEDTEKLVEMNNLIHDAYVIQDKEATTLCGTKQCLVGSVFASAGIMRSLKGLDTKSDDYYYEVEDISACLTNGSHRRETTWEEFPLGAEAMRLLDEEAVAYMQELVEESDDPDEVSLWKEGAITAWENPSEGFFEQFIVNYAPDNRYSDERVTPKQRDLMLNLIRRTKDKAKAAA